MRSARVRSARDLPTLAGVGIAQLIECDGPGGAERVVADLAAELQAAGARSVVFVPAEGDGWLGRQLRGTGVAIEHFRLSHPISPSCASSIAGAFRRHSISIAHSHEFSMAVYGTCAARVARIPHVITMHGSRYYAGRLQRRAAMRAAIAMSAQTVAVSEQLSRSIRRDLFAPSSRVSTILNGVRPIVRGPGTLRRELGLSPAARLLVSVGNLYEVKGHAHLVDALGLLAAQHADVHLAISGRGDRARDLEARARALGLQARVHLLGLRADIPAVLGDADIFVLPSLSEGLPLALLEAMFAGCPIIATEVGEVSAALAHGQAGLLVAPGRAAPLAAAIAHLLTNPAGALALGRAAAQRAADLYSLDAMVQRYRAIYEGLLAERSPHGAVHPLSRLSPHGFFDGNVG